MKIVTTFHPSSSVLGSLKCSFSSEDIEYLVVAKLNKVEIFSILPEGLKLQISQEIWGKVLSIRSIPVSEGSEVSNLLVMVDHPDPELIFLSYSVSESGAPHLKVQKQLSLYERSPRPAEYCNDVLVHPSGRVLIASYYTGKLKVILTKDGQYESDFDASLPELNILSLAFLPSEDNYTLAILHIDYQNRIQLLSRDINVDNLELSPIPSTVLIGTQISSNAFPWTESLPKLIPVPALGDSDDDIGSLGGVVVASGRKLLFYELASKESQAKHRGKKRRLEEKKKSTDPTEAASAKEKEREREGRKRKAVATIDWPWNEITAWCTVDRNSPRFLLGDCFGKLSMLSLDTFKDNGLVLVPLGVTSPSTTLTYLTTQVLYVGSHMGDSQLVRISRTPISALDLPTLPIPSDIPTVSASSLISPSAKGKGKAAAEVQDSKGRIVNGEGCYLRVLETFKNIAPIMDAVLVDADGTGQRQIVTCSGGKNTGSVNIIRNGADFHELAVIAGLHDVTNIWPIRGLFDDKTHTHILISTLHATHLLSLNSTSTISRVENASRSFITNEPTLAFSNVSKRVSNAGRSEYQNSSLVVQVTPTRVIMLEFDIGLGEYTQVGAGWGPESLLGGSTREIVAASINASQVVLALSRAKLVLLNFNDETINMQKQKDLFQEISSVSCLPVDPSKCYSKHVILSYWRSNHVEILSTTSETLEVVSKTPTLPSLPCSLLLHNFGLDQHSKGSDYHPYLLVGLADGSLVSFSFKDNELKDQKIISLGYAPVSFTVCEIDGQRTVFASGNRATILFWDKERLHHSPVLLKDVVAASCLNTSHFPSSLILSTPSSLSIGNIKDLDKLHIRSIPLGLDNPRKIVHDPSFKVFGVACNRTEPVRVGDPESMRSSFRLLDNSTLNHLSQYNCEPDEEITALETITMDLDGSASSFFCVGTYTYRADEAEPTEGRLLIFRASTHQGTRTPRLQLSLAASTSVTGCIYAFAVVDGMIAAAVNSSVIIFRLERSSSDYTIKRITEWNHNYFVTSLVSYGSHLIIGDGISSVSLLQLVDMKLKTVARDYGPLWPVSVQALDDKNVIGANTDLNLFTFIHQRTHLRSVLERNGSYHIADLVSKFVRGTLTASGKASDVALEPKQLFFTSSGRIGVIVDITDEALSLHLTALQRNLGYISKGVGGISHAKYRAPRNSRGRSDADDTSYGFLDGDFLEQFLTIPNVDQILAGQTDAERLIMPLHQMRGVLEVLQSLH